MGGLFLICILVFAYLSKPSNESFGESVAHQLPIGSQTIGKILINMSTNIHDFIFFKIAVLPIDKNSIVFVGIINYWIPIREIKIINK